MTCKLTAKDQFWTNKTINAQETSRWVATASTNEVSALLAGTVAVGTVEMEMFVAQDELGTGAVEVDSSTLNVGANQACLLKFDGASVFVAVRCTPSAGASFVGNGVLLMN